MTYTILHNENSETLVLRVNRMIRDDWEPLGRVSVFSSNHSPAPEPGTLGIVGLGGVLIGLLGGKLGQN
jgi:hypothetical protein